MKKFIAGIVIGVGLTLAVSAAASNGLIGKKIEGEASVTLNGTKIDTAIIVNGKSYAPIRSVAEASNLIVGYEKGVVKLETQMQTDQAKPLSYWEQTLVDLNGSLVGYKKLVTNAESTVQSSKELIARWQDILDNAPSDATAEFTAKYTALLNDAKAGLTEAQAELAERKAKVAEIEAEIAKVEAEIAKLK